LKPTLQAFAELTNNGLSGAVTPLGATRRPACPILAGGYDNLLGEIFRRNFPNYSAGFSLNIPAAQSRRAVRLRHQRARNAPERAESPESRSTRFAWMCRTPSSDCSRRARVTTRPWRGASSRSRPSTAIRKSTISAPGLRLRYQVVQDQRDLAAAQSSEAQAMANYTHARIRARSGAGHHARRESAPAHLDGRGWKLERAQAGGALPGVPSGASQAASIASGQGVQGSQAAAGLGNITSTSGNRGPSNATVTQVGPVTANLDPSISEASTFSHKTVPEPNVVQSITACADSGPAGVFGDLSAGFSFWRRYQRDLQRSLPE
jgi:hypothetical protein